jgi:hypothetical protein
MTDNPAPHLHVQCLLLALLIAGCARRSTAPSPPSLASPAAAVRFTDVTTQAGIHFQHTSGRSGRFYLPETLGAGCAFLDYNRDGKPDLFFVNGSRLPGYPGKGPFYSALYRNNGNGTFIDVTKEAGLAVDCYGLGVAVADYDGDGFEDLYLTALGPNHLFHNNGNGTFTDVTKRSGVGDARASTSAAWLDYDRDGWLDLFVCNYVQWTPATNHVCPDSLGRKHLCGPTYYTGARSTLFHNDGDGRFTDVTQKAGLAESANTALGVVVWDADGDGWPDLIVARDMQANLLLRNNRDGTFSERGIEAGIAFSSQGKSRAGMGIDTGDTTNSGRESILIGNNTGQGIAQFLPDDQGHFTDVAEQTGLYPPSLKLSTFGLAFVDYDGDGFKDIITANGHIDENIALNGGGITFQQSLAAYHNDGTGRFTPAGASLGTAFQESRLWRGLALGDYDGDGDPDLLLSSCNGKPALLRNDGGNRNAWLQVKAIAAGRNREGIGTKVTVTANADTRQERSTSGGKGGTQTGWIRSGSSYCSQHELTAFFGLGKAAQAQSVELQFPDGTKQRVANVRANQLIVVQEGKGLAARGAATRLP